MDLSTALSWGGYLALYLAVAYLYRKYFKGWVLALWKDRMQVHSLCAAAGFVVAYPFLFYQGWNGIDASASSTAAIGYVFVPVFAAIEALFFAAVAFALGCAIRAWRTRDRKHVLIATLGLTLSAGGIAYLSLETTRDQKLATTVHAIAEMDDVGLAMFLDSHEFRANQYALGAVAMNPHASGTTLTRIASLRDSSLHDRYGGTQELMGNNRKGLAVMRLVAAHPHVESSTLELLASSRDAYVLRDVAAHKLTPQPVIERLYREGRNASNAILIDGGLATNIAAPAGILGEIAKQSRNQYTLHSLANNTGAADDLRKLAANRVSSRDYEAF
jgi:hypothetical protein